MNVIKSGSNVESKRTAIEQQNIPEEENIPDFTAVPIQTQLLSVEKADVNQQEVEKLANELSKVFENYPEFINSKVNIKVFDANVLYLNSENIKYLQAFGLTKLSVNASIKTAEGEVLNDEFICYGNSYNQLPDKETLKNSILKMIATMQALCKAPAINQSYEGPVMFDQEAVGYIVSEAFFNSSNALISKRKNIESGASSFDVFALLGGENSKINKYEAQIGKEVIDKNISLTAIDKTTMFENTPLIGSYVVMQGGV